MANQELYNKSYKIPLDVLKTIQTALMKIPTGNGVKRAKFMLKNGVITYQAMKKLKHDFDNNNFVDNNQYVLAGGDKMKSFIDTTLSQDRNSVERSKKIKRDVKVDVNLGTKAFQTPRLNEEKKENIKNAIAIIVNKDNKILLLKRSNEPKQWMPGKWSLVGGGLEKGESPEKAVEREIKEETGLEINKFNKRFNIQRSLDSTEYIFACRYNGDPTDITLNNENTNYGWYDISEMEFLDTVPNLKEYILLSFKKYQ